MGEHDDAILAGPSVILAFEEYVQVEGELLELLNESYENDRRMLEETGSTGAE